MNALDVSVKWNLTADRQYSTNNTKKIVFKVKNEKYYRYYGLASDGMFHVYPIHTYWQLVSTNDARTMWSELVKHGFYRYYIEDDFMVYLVEEENGDW